MKMELRSVAKEGIPKSLLKAHQYRLLSEPWHAESICRDVLAADEGNQQAVDILALALSDQFRAGHMDRFEEARLLLHRLENPYRRTYLAGLIRERHSVALLARSDPESKKNGEQGLRLAMEAYDQAIGMSPPGDEDAVLRWNACVRLLQGQGSE